MNTGSKASVIAIVAILAGLGGYKVMTAGAPAPVTPEAPPAAPPAAPAAAVSSAPAPALTTAAEPPAPAAEPSPQPAAAAAPAETGQPSFDLVRVEPDGSAVVAGQVAPLAQIALQLDGVEVATAKANDTGNFVAMFALAPSDTGRLLTLSATLADGRVVTAPASVAIGPTRAAAPLVNADAQPKPDATPGAAAPETAPAAVVVTDSGAKLLQAGTESGAASDTASGTASATAGTVTLDVISYPGPDAVQFGGKGQVGSFVRLYLDNQPLGEAAPVAGDGSWTMTRSAIAPGLYTLRADALDGSGKVISRYETPFKRETPEALAAAATTPAPTLAPTLAPTSAPTPAPTSAATTTEAAPSAAAPAAASDQVAAVAPPAATAGAEPGPLANAPEGAALPAPDATAAAVTPPAGSDAPAATAEPGQPMVEPSATSGQTAPAKPAAVTITVQPGYTLWGIAKKQMGEGVLYVQVYKANKDKIKNPDLIYPGQVFSLPQN